MHMHNPACMHVGAACLARRGSAHEAVGGGRLHVVLRTGRHSLRPGLWKAQRRLPRQVLHAVRAAHGRSAGLCQGLRGLPGLHGLRVKTGQWRRRFEPFCSGGSLQAHTDASALAAKSCEAFLAYVCRLNKGEGGLSWSAAAAACECTQTHQR